MMPSFAQEDEPTNLHARSWPLQLGHSELEHLQLPVLGALGQARVAHLGPHGLTRAVAPPVYMVISRPALTYVPSRKQTKLTAGLLAYVAADG